MTLLKYLFEGQADGTSATAANTGASVVSKAGGTSVFSTAAAAHGATGIRFTFTGGQQNIIRLLASAANNQMAFSGVFAVNAAPVGGGIQPLGLRQSTNDVYIAKVIVDTAMAFTFVTSSGQVIGSPYTLTAGTKYRIEVVLTGGSTTAGVVAWKLYSMASTLLASGSSTTANLTANTPNGCDIGSTSGSSITNTVTVDWDDVQFNDGATAEIGPTDTALATPVVTLTKTNPTTSGGSDGTVTATWPAVSGAHHYESDLQTGSVTSGFTADDTNATSPKTYTGLAAGTYTVAVRAKAS